MSDLREMVSEIHIEEPSGSFLPVLTPEVAEWLAKVSLSLGRSFGGGLLDPRVYETIARTAVYVTRFVPNDILLGDGCQRATFAVRQLAGAMGLDEESTKGVQRALRVLSLTTKAQDPSGYRKACELLSTERAGVPVIECIEKSTARGRASVWRLVGVSPRIVSVTDEGTVVPSGKPVVVSAKSAVGSAGFVVETPKPVVENGMIVPTTESCSGCNGATEYTSAYDGRQCADFDAPVVGNITSGVAEMTTLNHSLPTSLLSGRDAYPELVSLFPCAPGVKEEETLSAYNRLIGRGYQAGQLLAGARRYLECGGIADKARFPLTFLKDSDLVAQWCGSPMKRIDAEKLIHIGGPKGRWTYPGKQGLFYVENCPSSATREEAFVALSSMADLNGKLG